MKTVIFDFDGTLADTLATSVRIFEKLTNRPEPFSDADIARFRGLTVVRVVRELRIRPWRMPWLLVRGRSMMRQEMESIVIFDGTEDVLQALKSDGIRMYIMSSNSPGNIHKLLRRIGIDDYFRHVYGNVGILSKAKMLRRIIERNKLVPADTFYVGDEGRDIEAAKRVGLKSVAVSWGFNSAELLASHRPHAIADSRPELRAILLK